jgi:hypothetical protein
MVALAHPSRRELPLSRQFAPQDEVVKKERPHPEEPSVAQATIGVSKDGPRLGL